MAEAQIRSAFALWAFERFGNQGWELTVERDDETLPLPEGGTAQAELVFQQHRSTLALRYDGNDCYRSILLATTNVIPTA